jgi:hypothetical protein
MAYGTINADLMTTSDGVSSSGLYGFKNRIINGAMVIDQRNAGASVSVDGSAPFCMDRWFGQDITDGAFSVQQVSDAPAGFVNSAKITITTADTSLAATQRTRFCQPVEGYNIADLGWGTANAQTITLSFWVKSSLTGTFGGNIGNESRSYPFTYTITTANTWEYETITIAGDTSGTWNTTNSSGFKLMFSLGAGSSFLGTAGAWATADYWGATGQVQVIATNGATFYITGVQLEKGSTATSFDYRSYQTELALCKRYFRIVGLGGVGAWDGTTVATIGYSFNDSEMRSSPTATISTSTPTITQPGVADRVGSGSTISGSTTSVNGCKLNINGFTGATNQNIAMVITSNLATLSSEL